ncbi:uncharacterized protein LOC103510753 isoform X1 [Diaphorina citri]|uniref:Uncharacterized protein LOC103510753 isoform X1 n=2 Tax=Diaphorina citri TaxID=121845 RepID=A0A1S3D538_DIACI|nr:uncharacterized protein LOC103510753 isoform X1 [Diaphorina citri]
MVLDSVFKYFKSEHCPITDDPTCEEHEEEDTYIDYEAMNECVIQPECCPNSCHYQKCGPSRKRKIRRKSKLDRLIDKEFDELDSMKEKVFKKKNNCLQMEKFRVYKPRCIKQEDIFKGCRHYNMFPAQSGCGGNETWPPNRTYYEGNCTPEQQKTNCRSCLSRLDKLRNRFWKDVDRIYEELDMTTTPEKYVACDHSLSGPDRINDRCKRDYNGMHDWRDPNETSGCHCDHKLDHMENVLERFEQDIECITRSGSEEKHIISTSRSPDSCVAPTNRVSASACLPAENHNCEKPCKIQNNTRIQNENKDCANNTNDYSHLEKILGKNNKLELKECEFVFKSPVNKNYLIKIQEISEKPKQKIIPDKNKRQDGISKHGKKFMNFITGKGFRNKATCVQEDNATCILEDNAGSQTCDSRYQKDTLNDKVETRDYQCRNDKDRTDICHSKVCQAKNNEPYDHDIIDAQDEFRFLNELCHDDHSDTIERKLEKKKFYEGFLRFLQENKSAIRRQYQQYCVNCPVAGESGDYNYY